MFLTCYDCGIAFSILRCIRKHHCRLCGRIFCYDCSNFHMKIPDYLLSEQSKKGTWNDYISYYTQSNDLTKYKVCRNCNDVLKQIELVDKIIEVFIIAKFDIVDLWLLSKICKLWQYAANFLLSMFRYIQYKLPTDNYTSREKSLLWINSRYIVQHNKYLVHLLKICDGVDDFIKVMKMVRKQKKINCWTMMCSRNCKNKLTSMDAFNLLVHNFLNKKYNKYLESVALENLICDDTELKCYLPILVYFLRCSESGDKLLNFLIKRCSKTIEIYSALYWEFRQYSTDEKIISVYKECGMILDFHSNMMNNITRQLSFINVVTNIIHCVDHNKNCCDYNDITNDTNITNHINITNKMDNAYSENHIISPMHPSILIKGIDLEKIKIKDSATKPIFIPFITNDNKPYTILYKSSDVIKDQIILNIIKIIDIIIKQEEHVDLDIVTYEVLPINKDQGIIKIVDNCDTIYHIKTKLNTTILNYILENNGDAKIKDVREKFIKSTAAYCVITYVLGIGDRHLDNIMITKDGKLFHIDYGYILGNDTNYGTPGIRITPEIIEALGGVNSIHYTQFTELCTKIYNCLRRNIDIIMNMVLMLPVLTSMDITNEQIIDSIIKRLIPGENYKNAQLHFENQLENQSYTNDIKDWFHYFNKEKIGSIKSYFGAG